MPRVRLGFLGFSFFPSCLLIYYHRHLLCKVILNNLLDWSFKNSTMAKCHKEKKSLSKLKGFYWSRPVTCSTADILKIPPCPYYYPFFTSNCSVMVIVRSTPCSNYLQLTEEKNIQLPHCSTRRSLCTINSFLFINTLLVIQTAAS